MYSGYSALITGKNSLCHSCDASCKTCFGPQALDCSSCFKGGNIFYLFFKYLPQIVYCLLSYLFVPQDNSWTRRVPVCHSVHLAPLLTLPLCCVRNAHQTVSRVWTTVITASAAPKVAINRFTTGGAVGETAQSKSLDNLSVIIAFFCFYLY